MLADLDAADAHTGDCYSCRGMVVLHQSLTVCADITAFRVLGALSNVEYVGNLQLLV